MLYGLSYVDYITNIRSNARFCFGNFSFPLRNSILLFISNKNFIYIFILHSYKPVVTDKFLGKMEFTRRKYFKKNLVLHDFVYLILSTYIK